MPWKLYRRRGKRYIPGKAGYDGRGVQVLRSDADLDKAFDAPSLIEQFVDFEKEIAVLVARNPQGAVVRYPIV